MKDRMTAEEAKNDTLKTIEENRTKAADKTAHEAAVADRTAKVTKFATVRKAAARKAKNLAVRSTMLDAEAQAAACLSAEGFTARDARKVRAALLKLAEAEAEAEEAKAKNDDDAEAEAAEKAAEAAKTLARKAKAEKAA